MLGVSETGNASKYWDRLGFESRLSLSIAVVCHAERYQVVKSQMVCPVRRSSDLAVRHELQWSDGL